MFVVVWMNNILHKLGYLHTWSLCWSRNATGRGFESLCLTLLPIHFLFFLCVGGEMIFIFLLWWHAIMPLHADLSSSCSCCPLWVILEWWAKINSSIMHFGHHILAQQQKTTSIQSLWLNIILTRFHKHHCHYQTYSCHSMPYPLLWLRISKSILSKT